MPPEILNYIIHENEGEYEEELYQEVMANYRNPWAIDMWSLGCVLLEIIVGVPLWMSLPLLVPAKNGSYPHNRSSSMYRDKKDLRLHTDYDNYESSQTNPMAHYTKLSKKIGYRRDTYDCQGMVGWKPMGVQSTKHNPSRNMELKSMFRNPREEKKSKNSKVRGNNHPFLKFITKKQEREKVSPYKRPNQPRYSSQHSELSVSVGKPRSSISKKPQLFLNKHHINLKP